MKTFAGKLLQRKFEVVPSANALSYNNKIQRSLAFCNIFFLQENDAPTMATE